MYLFPRLCISLFVFFSRIFLCSFLSAQRLSRLRAFSPFTNVSCFVRSLIFSPFSPACLPARRFTSHLSPHPSRLLCLYRCIFLFFLVSLPSYIRCCIVFLPLCNCVSSSQPSFLLLCLLHHPSPVYLYVFSISLKDTTDFS